MSPDRFPAAGTPPLYCNPLPIPAIPVGRNSRDRGYTGVWWREFGDPTVIKFQEAWYLFPSCGMVWKSTDFRNWEFHRINLYDVGWAPSVVEWRGKLYLTASWEGTRLWCAEDPLGEWRDLGPVCDEQGRELAWCDPMLFADPHDGELYAYYSLGVNRGVYGVRLDPEHPCRFAGAPTHCFAYRPEHPWERFGEFQQNQAFSHLEGAQMTCVGENYYLQYSAAGAEWRNYAVGCYRGSSPLGPFTPQQRNPVLIQRGGMLNGCGHHSVVEGPDGRLWAFYTVLFRRFRGLERRIAMDPVRFTADGELYVDGPSETPRFLDGSSPDWLPLTCNQPVRASSEHPDYPAAQALDGYVRSYWRAAGPELPQELTVTLQARFELAAARIIFQERLCAGEPAPAVFQYRIEGSEDGTEWFVLSDHRDDDFDGHIRFDSWTPRPARLVRLRITGTPPETPAGVTDFTVFGRYLEP